MSKPKVDPMTAKIIRSELEKLIGHHGFGPVRWVLNKLAKACRLREQLLADKKRIDTELEKVERMLR